MTTELLGRDHPVAQLRALVTRTAESYGGLVLLAGEAGIGKSALVADVVQQARSRGAVVGVGSCWSSPGAPELWPWTQIAGALQRTLGSAAWAEVTELAGLDPARPRDPLRTGAEEEFRWSAGVASAVTALAADRPLVLVVEDLHWADPASARLLVFLARHCWFERVLLVATVRDTEVERSDHPVREAFGQLVATGTTITLRGLDAAAVSALAARSLGRPPSAELVAELVERTGGNPFFVEQATRLWAGGPGGAGPPAGVREVVRARCDPLGADAAALLAAGAVLGREVDRALVTAVAGLPPAAAASAVALVVQARLWEPLGDGRYRFVHDLVRETVLDDLPADRAAALHAAVVDVVTDGRGTLLPGELADHAVRAGALVDRGTAVDLLVAAARDADGRLALQEAVAAYRRARDLATDPGRRALVRLDLAAVLQFADGVRATGADGGGARGAGSRAEPAAREEFAAAVADARRAAPEVLARVALAVGRHPELVGGQHLALLRESGAGLGIDVDGLADDQLLDAVVGVLSTTARTTGDDEALTTALTSQHDSTWGPGSARERERLMVELEQTARRTGDRDTEQFASSLRWVALLELGDPRYLTQFRAFVALADRYRTPRFSYGSTVDRAVIADFLGRHDEAGARLAELTRMVDDDRSGADLGGPFRWMIELLTWGHLRASGRPEQAPAALTEGHDMAGIDRALLLAVPAAEAGDWRSVLPWVRATAADPTRVERSVLPLWWRVLTLVAVASGDRDLIAVAEQAQQPHRGQWCVSLWGCDVGGPVDLHLGVLALAAGRRDRARELLATARASAEAMGTRRWVGEVDAALGQLAAPGAADPRASSSRPAGDAPPPQFRRAGTVWVLGWAGTTVHLPDAKGMADLHRLLGRPGVDVAAAELAHGGDPAAARALALGADPVLDDEARRRYRARLDALDTLIDDAALAGDTAGRDRCEAEREALLAELRAAAGLGGRRRRLGDTGERARKAVTARIRDALRRIGEQHPALADHLTASVRTGVQCSYRPGVPVRWQLDPETGHPVGT